MGTYGSVGVTPSNGCFYPTNFGEKLFVSKACQYLDNNHIIYWNRQLFGREFDVCILMPGKGILVVELKGWREENILRVENNEYVVVQTENGEIHSSPQKQARGYRFSLERHLRQSIDKFPLVCQLVCLPQVSKNFYHANRLDVVMEERFTLLKEDLEDNTAFFAKLDQALREVATWKRDPFDKRTMLEVRNLFETGIDLSEDNDSESSITNIDFHQHDYSRFIYMSPNESFTRQDLDDLVTKYLAGCKIYGVFSDGSQLHALAAAVDSALLSRGIIRNGENLEYAFENSSASIPVLTDASKDFKAFHITLCITSQVTNIPTIKISNGCVTEQQISALKTLSGISSFNVEQYLVEHADANKNIVIRAGAGTGKTYTMISRIAFVCYTQNVTNHGSTFVKILDPLEKGDVVCHVYQNMGQTILDDSGKVRKELIDARNRGVIFDAADEYVNFSFDVLKPAVEQGFYPDIIASDLTTLSAFNNHVYGLPLQISKYLALGMSLPKVLNA